IKANETLLVRAIANLISNAIKFTPKEGEIKLIISKLDDQLSIEVKDTGIGIPEELCPYIFHKFSGAKRVGLNQEKANGLGLHITKKLIELHHGTISFSSKEGHGSSFNILLPAEPLAYK
ncbi:MAG: ATP-binding protein, partial [Bacteroidota bacterium]